MVSPIGLGSAPPPILSSGNHQPLKQTVRDREANSPLINSPTSTQRRKLVPKSVLEPDHHRADNYWDSLSEVHLSKSALREFDRRKKALRQQHTIQHSQLAHEPRHLYSQDTKRFARGGGPDLTHLRGLAERVATSAPESQKTTTSALTWDSEMGPGSKSSVYNPKFWQQLVDLGVYPENHEFSDGQDHPEPKNLDAIQQRLRVPRASLSLSNLTDAEFKAFRKDNKRSAGETKVCGKVIPIIAGAADGGYYTEEDRKFNNLHPIDEHLAPPQSDFYDGEQPDIIPVHIRDALDKYIIPCTNTSLPLAPNFFGVWKGFAGRADAALLQATIAGAVGARAMHKLQNYGAQEVEYDNRAYTYCATYQAGTGLLTLYSTHMTAPKMSGNEPEYHMTQLDTFTLAKNQATFVQGVSAFRNLRELASEHRKHFIREATKRTKQHPANLSSSVPDTTQIPDSMPLEHSSNTSADELTSPVNPNKRRRNNG